MANPAAAAGKGTAKGRRRGFAIAGAMVVGVAGLLVAAVAMQHGDENPAAKAPSTTARPAAAARASTTATPAHASHQSCSGMDYTPLGALPPATPMFCTDLVPAPPTFVEGENSWVDDFDHGASMAELGEGYVAFEGLQQVNRSATFRHKDHWMVDVNGPDEDGGGNNGGSMIRPDRSFQFVDGKLVVEADVAAGIVDYRGQVWPELVVTTSPEPARAEPYPDVLYAYGKFPDAETVGIRLQSDGTTIAALFGPDNNRTFELSYFQSEGARVFGGHPSSVSGAHRFCGATNPDTDCRDRFRWELTKDTQTLYINGVKYMQHAGLPAAKQLPEALVNGDVYVYFASWIHHTDAETVRFHWDRVAVNP